MSGNILESWAEKGVRLWSDGENIRFQARCDMDAAMLRQLKEQKEDLKQALNHPYEMNGTPSQLLFYLMSRNEASAGACLVPAVICLEGSFEPQRLENAFNTLMTRFPELRTHLKMDGAQLKQVVNPYKPFKLEVEDYRGVVNGGELVREEILRNSKQALNINEGEWWRARLLQRDENRWVLLICVHHALCDAAGLRYRIGHLATLYHEEAAAKIPMPAPYIRSFPQHSSNQWWAKQLSGMEDGRFLPERSGLGTSTECLAKLMPGKLHEALQLFVKERHVSLFTILQTSLHLVLWRWQKERELLMGVVTDLRDDPEPSSQLGDFSNFLPIRHGFSPELSCESLLKQALDFQLSMLEHRNLPFSEILKESGCNVLFNVVFILQDHFRNASLANGPEILENWNLPISEESGWGIPAYMAPTRVLNNTLDVDLRVEACELEEGLFLNLTSRNKFLSKFELERLVAAWHGCIKALVNARPDTLLGDINILPPIEPLEKRRDLAVFSNFTAEPIEPILNFWGDKLNAPFRTRFLQVDQVFQHLLEGKNLCKRGEGENLLLVSPEAWLADGTPYENLPDIARELTLILTIFFQNGGGYLTLALCPNWRNETAVSQEDLQHLNQFYQILEEAECEMSQLKVLTPEHFHQFYSELRPGDPKAFEVGRTPYNDSGFTAIGSACFRAMYARKQTPIKVIVLDCDNTLWDGVIGEDGLEGIRITPPFKALQKFMLNQMKQGRLICLASKNKHEDVMMVLERSTEMVLRPEHIVDTAINWAPKSENIRILAERLGLGLNSFLFIDDNPCEIAEVRTQLPAVLALELPQDHNSIPSFLNHIWTLDVTSHTNEDQRRTELYRNHSKRERLRSEMPNLKLFLEKLDLKVDIHEPEDYELERLIQLSRRVNQFHTSLFRLDPETYKDYRNEGGRVWVAHVADRFGNYGLCGVMLAKPLESRLHVDAMMLSCRALGRGVENKMLDFLNQRVQSLALKELGISFKLGPRNQPAQLFLETLLGYKLKKDGVHVLPTTRGRLLDPVDTSKKDKPSQTRKSSILYTSHVPETVREIATSLSTTEGVLKAIESQTKFQPSNRNIRLPRSTTEERLAGLWSQLLFIESVGIDDNFFELGGTSLLAVKMVSRLAQLFPVNLTLDEVLEAGSLEALASFIDHRIAGIPDSGEKSTVESMLQDALLPQDIQPQGQIGPRLPLNILLTGATGFLGAHLLNALLHGTAARITCLVRAENMNHAKKRVFDNLAIHGIPYMAAEDRIQVVAGDLSKPQLGLSDKDWLELSHEIDAIYHNGAAVNFAYPYAMLKEVNVAGTREVLRLAFLNHTKPVSMISSFAVFDRRWDTSLSFDEADCQNNPEGYYTGYARSKWAAEQLLMEASYRGLPIYVFRPGDITADIHSMKINQSDMIVRFLRGSLAVGLIPNLPFEVQFMQARQVARAVVALSSGNPGYFHLTNPDPIPLNQIIDLLRDQGHNLKETSFDEWIAALREDEGNELEALLPFLSARNGQEWSRLPRLNSNRTVQALANRQISWQGPKSEALRKILSIICHGIGYNREQINMSSIELESMQQT